MAVLVKPAPTSKRAVVNLTSRQQLKLARFAAKEHVSSSEILSRSLDLYEPLADRIRKQEEERLVEAALDMITTAVREMNQSIERTCDQLDQLHLQLSVRSPS